jgi:Transglutaminase-like superfamily
MQTWLRYWRMSGYARRIVLEAACGLVATHASLRLAGFRRWKAAIEWLTPVTPDGTPAFGQPEIEFAHAIANWEAAAARHLPLTTNCLDRSITLWWLLRRRGVAADLRIGGRKENGVFEAHAWVELEGAVVDTMGSDRYEFVPFESRMIATETRVP